MLHHRRSRNAEVSQPSNPAFMTDEQIGQPPFANNPSLRSSFLKFSKFSSPIASESEHSHDRFTVDFLKTLRNDRPVRPGGARPKPRETRNSASDVCGVIPQIHTSNLNNGVKHAVERENDSSSLVTTHDHNELASLDRNVAGRPLARQPFHKATRRNFSSSTTASNATANTSVSSDTQGHYPRISYYERGQRWMEKQESISLSVALEEMDVEANARLHAAAQDEAADLVWKHQNPGASYKNTDVDFKQHLRKGSHARSQSIGPFDALYVQKGGTISGSRSSSGGSTSTTKSGITSSDSSASRMSSFHPNQMVDNDSDAEHPTTYNRKNNKVKAYGSLKFSLARAPSFSRRHSSDKDMRAASGQSDKSVFSDPNDQIYEEPEEAATARESYGEADPSLLKNKPRNISHSIRNVKEKLSQWPNQSIGKLSRVDIHKNPPSQSRNAVYTENSPGSEQALETSLQTSNKRTNNTKDLEIRGEDIIAATSIKLKDRSSKLLMPSVISDSPGRPIVSFDRHFDLGEAQLGDRYSDVSLNLLGQTNGHCKDLRKPVMLPSNSEPIVPSINTKFGPISQVHENSKTSPLSKESIPELVISEDLPSKAASSIPSFNLEKPGHVRPLPNPNGCSFPQPGNRPLPHHSSTAPVKSSSHWSPAHHSMNRGQAQCAACALPIAGKIVSAASLRFHPSCFSCFNCGELLECVAFYPEPENSREERLARISARTSGGYIPEGKGQHTEEDDGGSSVRFYCHLDFHEKFSPKCRSCKTPIEGEVVVACGGDWHVGHFFCAECGDPFDQATPFVEKDGFAWCVGCHTNRFSGKCAGCRKPIVETVIRALGSEWHEDCFCCKECGDKFKDGKFFTRDDNKTPVCVKCEERRLKA